MLLDFGGSSSPSRWWKDKLNTDTPESKQIFCFCRVFVFKVSSRGWWELLSLIHCNHTFVFSFSMTISVFMLCRFENSRLSAIRSLCVGLVHWDFLTDKPVVGTKAF